MKASTAVGMLAVEGDAELVEALAPLWSELSSALEEGFPPSLALGVVGRDGLRLSAHGGLACAVGTPVPATPATAYDLASLTKVVCTVTLTLQAVTAGRWALADPVRRWLPGFPRLPGGATTIWHLLTHTSGLVPHRPFFETCSGRPAIETAVYGEAAGTTPGDVVAYSDLNFLLLGWALERCLGAPLDTSFAAQVARPLGMARARFRPAPADRGRVAATELDGDQRLAPGLVWGEVHDGNAHALGGVAGHAGLFADLDDLARFVRALLAPAELGVLEPAAVALLATRQAATGDDVRGIGWRLEPDAWGRWPEGTVWHTGFTGTSLLVAPAAGVGVVLLTNAVHPRRRLDDQAALRTLVHRRLAGALA